MDTVVDGAAVRRVGDVTLPLVRDCGADLVAVPEGQICTEMLDLYQADGIIAEPAGALASAALSGGLVALEPGQTVVCVLSGGNNDVSRYAEVIERSLVHRGLKHYFLVEFPQEPGALRRFLDEVLGPDDDITLFEYIKRNNRDVGPALVGIEHKTLGEEPAAVVTLKPGAQATEAELRAFVADRLAAFKVPVKVEFWHETLPRNANGKIMKNELKKVFEEG